MLCCALGAERAVSALCDVLVCCGAYLSVLSVSVSVLSVSVCAGTDRATERGTGHGGGSWRVVVVCART